MAENLTHLLATQPGLRGPDRPASVPAPAAGGAVCPNLVAAGVDLADGGHVPVPARRSFLAVWVPSLVDVATPQAVVEGAYDG